jgi:glycosyltransferase involved in cell wall biosynthesis
MACGAAIIAADSPGIRELIQHRQNGYLCATTPDGIRQAITEVLSDSILCFQMGQAARQYAVDHFSLDKILQMELYLYKELMSDDMRYK